MVNLDLGSKVLSEVKTAYQIHCTHEKSRTEVKINKILGKLVLAFLQNC